MIDEKEENRIILANIIVSERITGNEICRIGCCCTANEINQQNRILRAGGYRTRTIEHR